MRAPLQASHSRPVCWRRPITSRSQPSTARRPLSALAAPSSQGWTRTSSWRASCRWDDRQPHTWPDGLPAWCQPRHLMAAPPGHHHAGGGGTPGAAVLAARQRWRAGSVYGAGAAASEARHNKRLQHSKRPQLSLGGNAPCCRSYLTGSRKRSPCYVAFLPAGAGWREKGAEL